MFSNHGDVFEVLFHKGQVESEERFSFDRFCLIGDVNEDQRGIKSSAILHVSGLS